ncbi:MAG: SpoIIE family protein phosphatase [Bacteroidetes bacterium]|nr:SpoIIE family protein phosphatase [Bacteroidota bacterium]
MEYQALMIHLSLILRIGPWDLLLVIILLIVIGNFFFIKWRDKKFQYEIQVLEEKISIRTVEVLQQKFELERKNELIAEKNKEMTDSLNYAKRIQAAILPKPEIIHSTFSQSFILYMPKDIVSGDFYSFTKKNNRVIIAAADCTGHGVAGAIMSMIGSSLMHQVINEKGITDPGEILGQLNLGIIDALKQAENSSHDGMDVCLCAFDMEKSELVFAGANRPLWIIRNGILESYKSDKFPIGGLQIEHKESFTNQRITLQKNDTIYLFSDGYADQFGGLLGKKLMTKKFKEVLISIQDKSMNEQGDYLHQFIKDWMGNVEQVDDIMVIGIRI